MKRLTAYLCVVLGVGFVLVGAAPGAEQQWLRYRSSSQPDDLMGGAYGQIENKPQTPPEGLELPKFKSDEPLFARWRCPAAKDGIAWVAFDRSGKDAPFDLLYIDSDLDGSLADETPLKPDEMRNDKNRQYTRAYFKLVKVTLPGEDGAVSYHLNVIYSDSRGRTRVYFSPAGWYEGPVTVGENNLWCTLIDCNGNGHFNDCSLSRRECDRIRIAPKGDRSFRDYEKDTTTRFVGAHVEVDGKLYKLHVAPDGAYVKFSPVTQPPTGAIQVNEGVSTLSVFGEQGHFFRQLKNGAADIPAGEYKPDKYVVSRTDDNGRRWEVREYGAARENPFTVEEGKKTKLDIGEPFVCKLNASQGGKGEHLIAYALRSRNRDNLLLRCNGSRPPAPRVRITNADKSYDRNFRMEYG
jgi:hypothetical protein